MNLRTKDPRVVLSEQLSSSMLGQKARTEECGPGTWK